MTPQVPLEIEQLTRLVAIKTGKTPSGILKEGVEARADAAVIPAEPRRRTPEEIEQRLKEIAGRVAALPVLDDRSPDGIIGYNEAGLPGGYQRPERRDRQVLGLDGFTDADLAAIENARAPAEAKAFDRELKPE